MGQEDVPYRELQRRLAALEHREALGQRLLLWSRKLLDCDDERSLMHAVVEEVEASLGFTSAWLYSLPGDATDQWRLLMAAGSAGERVMREVPVLAGETSDMMLQEIRKSERPVLVVDARTDPRTDKRIVETMQNRTILNMSLRLMDQYLGVLGAGTFGEEGGRVPTPEQLEYFEAMAGPLVVALGRIQFARERARNEAEKAELQRRFLEAQKSESLALMAGGVAHDFNNLLTGVLGNAALAREQVGETDEIATLLAAIETSASRAADLAQQMLTYSGRAESERQSCDLEAVVREMRSLLGASIPKGVRLEIESAGDSHFVHADPTQMRQMVMNLITNGAQAIGDAPGEVRVRVAREVSEGNELVVLEVRDTGCGMDEATRERLFDPFFTTKEDGRGLGLAAVLGIVRSHGGRITIESELGRGSLFKVTLHATEARTPARPSRAPSPGANASAEAGGRVLVIDDEEAVRSLARRKLERVGFEVEEAADGAAGLALFESRPRDFRLVVLDLTMPEVNGVEVYERIRAIAQEVPILLSSGFSDRHLPAALAADPKVRMLPKPYRPTDLADAVSSLLGTGT
ncbi:MAG: ATP-binding protein [Proteobacteria bacterium]|nr:ATP-binding protein [Pseudomonadota bacterium]